MKIPVFEVSGKHAEVLTAFERVMAKFPGSTLVAVERVTDRKLSARELAGIAAMGGTPDAVCKICGAKCWWTAKSRAAPGPLAPVCVPCLEAELALLRTEASS